jgi:hypothetical protein
VGELAARAEVVKLAHQLGVTDDSLDFLYGAAESDVAELGAAVARTLHVRHAPRFERAAALARLMPAGVTAPIAQNVFGAVLCARIAGVMAPAAAAKLAGHFTPEFLADVGVALDPARSGQIIALLPTKLIVDVGTVLLRRGEYITIGQFFQTVSDEAALGVVHAATGEQLLHTAFYTADFARLDRLITQVPDEQLRSVIDAAIASDHLDEALALLVRLGSGSRARLASLAADSALAVVDSIVAAICDLDVWSELLPVIAGLSEDTRRAFVNVPTTLDQKTVRSILHRARDAGLGGLVKPFLSSLDEAHAAVLHALPEFTDPDWAAVFR